MCSKAYCLRIFRAISMLLTCGVAAALRPIAMKVARFPARCRPADSPSRAVPVKAVMNETTLMPAIGRRPSIAILVLISAVNPLAMNIYLPSLPALVDVFDTTLAKVQLTVSLYLAAVAVAQIVIGPLSDKVGRRPVLLWGLVVFVAGSLICALSPSIGVFLAGRVLQAAGGCTGIVLGRAIVRDLYDRKQSASMIGYVTMGLAVAPMVGPAIGGIIDPAFGWAASSVLVAAVGTLVLAAAFVNLHETNRLRMGGGFGALVRSYGQLLALPVFWAYALTAAFTSCVFFAFVGGGPFIASEILNMSPTQIGFYFMPVAAGYIIGNWLSGRYSGTAGVARMILYGNILLFFAILSIGVFFGLGLLHPLSLFGPVFFVGLANGICLPSSIAGAVSVRPDLAGAASGLSGSLQIGFGAVTSALVGWLLSGVLWAGTVWPLVLVMAVACALTLICGFWARIADMEL